MEIVKSEGGVVGIQKGLGLANEDMRTLADTARMMGTGLVDQQLEIHKQSYDLGRAFNIETKAISRDIAKAMKDVKNFGGATIREIGVASTYARKLGLELEKITGTLQAFETFEGAAENVSKLAQSFGMNVDAFKLMEAQDPGKQVDLLRKSFFAAGQDASKFNRAQLKLLATSTGLDEATAKQAFSLKNQGASLDKINQKSKEAEKRQMDQAKAIKPKARNVAVVNKVCPLCVRFVVRLPIPTNGQNLSGTFLNRNDVGKL
jgi:hypothetical protein